MIFINYKILIVSILILFSFFNNLLFGFENLKAIHRTSDVECFLVSIDSNIKVENPFLSQVKIVYKYLVFYLFFFDISNPSSVIQILNYY